MTEETKQEKARRLVQNEIYANQGTLVKKLLEMGIAQYDEIQNLRVNPSDWSVAKCKAWLDDNLEDYPGDYYPGHWDDDALRDTLEERELDLALVRFGNAELSAETRSADAVAAILRSYDDDEDEEALQAWREAVEESRTGHETTEVYEWWLVSSYLLEKLKEAGEPVLECDEVNESWWGRTTTGQAIYLDQVIQDIANERD